MYNFHDRLYVVCLDASVYSSVCLSLSLSLSPFLPTPLFFSSLFVGCPRYAVSPITIDRVLETAPRASGPRLKQVTRCACCIMIRLLPPACRRRRIGHHRCTERARRRKGTDDKSFDHNRQKRWQFWRETFGRKEKKTCSMSKATYNLMFCQLT